MSDIGYKQDFVNDLMKPCPEFPMMVNISDCISNTIQNKFVIANINTFDVRWLKRCNDYIENLSISDKYTLKSYTKHGDELINDALRTRDWNTVCSKLQTYELDFIAIQIFKLVQKNVTSLIDINECILNHEGRTQLVNVLNKLEYDNTDCLKSGSRTQRLFFKILDDYVNDLTRIIANAPKVEKPILTFRGVKSDYLSTSNNTLGPKKGFQSSTYLPEISYEFKDCCIYEIMITPGMPCIALETISHYPKEREILIGFNVESIVGELASKPFFNSTFLNFEHDGQKYAFTEPQYIFEQLFNPWNKETDAVNVRRITLYPKKNETLHINRERYTRKINGGKRRKYVVLDNGSVFTPENREMTQLEKVKFYKTLKQVGWLKSYNLKKLGIDINEMEKLLDVPESQLDDNPKVDYRITRKSYRKC